MKVLEFNHEAEETIIFLHGSNVAGWMWGQQVPAFPDFHLLVPDLPGFGGSNNLEWTSLADTADQLAALIRERGHGCRAHVVGLSLGASLALNLIHRYPELVRRAFLASAIVTRPGLFQRGMSRVMVSMWDKQWFWTGLARNFRIPKADLNLFVETGMSIKKQTAQRIFKEFSTPEPSPAPPTRPVLVVAGGKDSRSISRDSLEVLGRLPGVVTAVAVGLHHSWNIEDVTLFNTSVRCWIVDENVNASLTTAFRRTTNSE